MSKSPPIMPVSSDFSDPNKQAICDLSSLKIIQLSGEDAQSFLQGQLSNDIEQVSVTRGQISAYCSPKGRTLALFTILYWKDHYLLLVSSDIAESIAQRLKMFVMRSKVEVEVAKDLIAYGLCGQSSASFIEHLITEISDEDYASISDDRLLACRLPGAATQYIIVGNTNEMAQFRESDPIRDLPYLSMEYWTWLSVLNGRPSITEHVQEAFVPQMINLDALDGISFTKGCYPGQEVVARTRYLGKIKRRMLPFEVHTADSVNAGDDIFPLSNQDIAENNSPQPLAKVVNAIPVGENKVVGLAVVQIEASDGKTLSIHSPQGAEITFTPLPYSLSNDDESEQNKV